MGRPIWNFPTCRRRRRWPSRNPDFTTWPNLPKKTKSKARRHRAPACGPVGPAMSRRKSCSRQRGPRTTTPPSSSALSTDSTSSTNSLGRTSPPGSYGFTLAQRDDIAIQTGGPLCSSPPAIFCKSLFLECRSRPRPRCPVKTCLVHEIRVRSDRLPINFLSLLGPVPVGTGPLAARCNSLQRHAHLQEINSHLNVPRSF